MKVNEKIKFLRQFKGWSQEEIANKLNMSLNGYGSIERGETDIPLSRLEQIAGVFNIELVELFGLNEKTIFNLSCTQNKSNWYIGSTSTQYLELKHELEKQALINKQKDEENALLKEQIAYLKEIIESLKVKPVM